MKTVLTIAGSDSSGGAGIQADLKTFSAFGVYGASVITAVTAQNSRGVISMEPVSTELVLTQAEAVFSDLEPDAVKVGMLFSPEIAEAVAAVLQKHCPPHLVVDPVLRSKNSSALLDPQGISVLMERILPLCELITPNIPEAGEMLGKPLNEKSSIKDAAKRLQQKGPKNVIIKGGHLEGDPIDILYNGKRFMELTGKRIQTPHTHGTGCTFASAMAASLALGLDMEAAFKTARDYVQEAIQNAPGFGSGAGPLNHLVRPVFPDEQNEDRAP